MRLSPTVSCPRMTLALRSTSFRDGTPALGRIACTLTLALASLGAAASPVWGQEAPNHLYDRWQLAAYGSSVILSSNVRVDGSQGEGTEVDAEDDLGLSRIKIQPRFAGRWRPGRRHELEAGYQFARRDADRQITRDFDFADTTFTAGLRVRSTFGTDQAFLNYRFAIYAEENTQAGLALGLGAIFLNVDLDALVGVTDGSQRDSVDFQASKSLTGPTGSLGAFGRFRVGNDWYLGADLRGVKVAIDRIDASVFEGGLAVSYFVSSAFGIEAGYGFSAITVDIGPKSEGRFDTSGKIKYALQHLRLGLLYVP